MVPVKELDDYLITYYPGEVYISPFAATEQEIVRNQYNTCACCYCYIEDLGDCADTIFISLFFGKLILKVSRSAVFHG
jgi:hypothetical protein